MAFPPCVPLMTMRGRWRHDRRVPRLALRLPQLSPWTQLLNLANDQALIASCGIDFESFLTLLTQVIIFLIR